MALATHPSLAVRFTLGRAISLLPACAFLTGYRETFIFTLWPGRGIDDPPPLAPRLKKEKSCNFTFVFTFMAGYMEAFIFTSRPGRGVLAPMLKKE